MFRYLHCNVCDRVTEIKNDDIDWVLTVPAIWNDSSKQFMREAAEMVGFLIIPW